MKPILMDGIDKFKIISVDYRMAPDFPYPATIADILAMYRKPLRTTSFQTDWYRLVHRPTS